MPHYKLTYFRLTAVAEPIRFLLSYGGIEFEDVRIDRADWPKIKATMPFGQLPVLEIDGKQINQSTAIGRYLAKQLGLAGNSVWEELEIDAVVDNIIDIRWRVRAYHYEKNAEAKAANLEIAKQTVRTYYEAFDAQVKENGGYFVGGALSWADLTFVAFLDHFDSVLQENTVENYENLKQLKEKVLAIPSIKAWVDKRPANAH